MIFIGFTCMDISLHVHASVLDYLTIMIVVFLCAVSICRISRQKLTQTRQHTSRWTAVGRGWPEPWGWATRRRYTGDSRRWTSAGSVWWPSPWRSGIDCILCGYQNLLYVCGKIQGKHINIRVHQFSMI